MITELIFRHRSLDQLMIRAYQSRTLRLTDLVSRVPTVDDQQSQGTSKKYGQNPSFCHFADTVELEATISCVS
jgi:hypothetical protein